MIKSILLFLISSSNINLFDRYGKLREINSFSFIFFRLFDFASLLDRLVPRNLSNLPFGLDNHRPISHEAT